MKGKKDGGKRGKGGGRKARISVVPVWESGGGGKKIGEKKKKAKT